MGRPRTRALAWFVCLWTALAIAACGPRPAPAPAVPPPPPPPRDARAAACLRAACDLLLGAQLDDGSFAPSEARWWHAGIAVRAWVGAYRILGDERDLAAAVRAMDRFVDEQQYHGGWCAWVWDSVPPSMRNSFNTADAGCITACLAILAPHVDAARAERYLAAHRRYLEQFVPRHDLGSGGFSNGWYEGMFHTSPYSVAAATQAVSFAAFHQATGEPAFLRRAERAVESMVAEWREDGRALFRPHDANNPRLLVATQFHDLYYMLEGMLWVFHNTNDEGLRDRIRVVWMNYLWGDRGLFAEVGEGDCWMEVARGPSAPKSRGILGVLCGIREAIGPASGLDRVIENGLRALCPGADQGAGDASGAPAAGDVGTPGIADAAGSTGGAGSEPTGSADERGPAKAKAAVGRPGLETIDHAFAALSLAEYLAPAANVMGAGAPPR